MKRVLNHFRNSSGRSALAFLDPVAAGLLVALIVRESKEQNYEIYLSPGICPILRSAGLPVAWHEFEGCRYQGPARQLLSHWKIDNLVIRDTAVIAYCRVKP